ncbi:MAG: protein-methionine-sulfoxide reductase catalytic subunit MsrP [Acetobacteraceae bacterium]|nr:protein-methionine-sulfoxide reductase catalytic subunit MsrP [Acetobacteraceae bacterium]
MPVILRRGWEIPASQVTPEAAVMRRRSVLAGAAALGLLPALGARAQTADGSPAKRNLAFDAGRALTDEKDATTYNNYYEFSESKNLWRAAQALPQSPWTLEIAGLVKQPRKIALDDLFKQVEFEERIYRHRCVEAWAMTVPWTGFTLHQLVRLADPLGSAKFVVLETAQDKTMPGLNAPFYPFPYIEAVTIEEAANELAFISTGLYGKHLPPQNGGPIRLTLPWKYGFKSAKALVKISFTEKRPQTFWEQIQPSEYGFWANVNPTVPHPRWSQASERLLGSDDRVATQLFNGYAPFVAGLYTNLKTEKLYM